MVTPTPEPRLIDVDVNKDMRVTSREVPDRYDSCTACLPSLHFGVPAMFQFPWRILSISGEILEETHVTIQSSLASSESPFPLVAKCGEVQLVP